LARPRRRAASASRTEASCGGTQVWCSLLDWEERVRHLGRHLLSRRVASEGLNGAGAAEVGELAPLRRAEHHGADGPEVVAKRIFAVGRP
jgi:hypothetical protein